ncbi:hypothetical protein SASPL_129470 [Salvia splendens]|uniref:Uncharacterized protein n=1 Tax=Salvia splendens TaxID=180675 RepID=A0A8X8ZPG6_SALSN|nr:hypothetical protein SASPL_129470 [Salvia splendens]
MDENEFRQLLELFPIVRSPDYCVSLSLRSQTLAHTKPSSHTLHLLYSFSIFWTCGCLAKLCFQAGSEFSSQLSGPAPSLELKERQDGCSTEDNTEAFWGKLKAAAEKKVGAADAEIFCKAFQQVYKKLVYEELTTDAAKRIMNSRTS